MRKSRCIKYRSYIMFLIKLAIYIVLGVSIWQVTAAKYKNTEKDIDENMKINISTDDDLRRQVADSIVLLIKGVDF